MSDQLDPDGTEGGAMGADNDLIRSLRADLKDAKATVKEAEALRESAITDARAQLARESTAQRLVDAAGYPGLLDVVLGKVDGEVTSEKVLAELQALALPIDSEAMQAALAGEPKAEGATQVATAQDVADVSSLGARVSAAAQGQDIDEIDSQLAAAKSPKEIAAIAQKGGFYDPS